MLEGAARYLQTNSKPATAAQTHKKTKNEKGQPPARSDRRPAKT
jgi:hypothetical protein